MTVPPSLGQPERSRRVQRRLVVESMRSLLVRLPLEDITLALVAADAGLTVPEVERVGATPAALLVLAYNDGLAEAVDAGLGAARPLSDPADALAAFAEPVVRSVLGARHRTAYQHELALGAADDRMRAAAFGTLDRVQSAVSEILRARSTASAPAIAAVTASVLEILYGPLGESLTGDALDAATARVRDSVRDIVAAAHLGATRGIP